MSDYYRCEDGIPFPFAELPAPGQPLDDLDLYNVLGPLLKVISSMAKCAYESSEALTSEELAGTLMVLQEYTDVATTIFARWENVKYPDDADIATALKQGDYDTARALAQTRASRNSHKPDIE